MKRGQLVRIEPKPGKDQDDQEVEHRFLFRGAILPPHVISPFKKSNECDNPKHDNNYIIQLLYHLHETFSK